MVFVEACVGGCVDSNATNTDDQANVDDGSCEYAETAAIFSEYAEGSSNNKYLEIYNATSEDMSLASYAFPLFQMHPGLLVNMSIGIHLQKVQQLQQAMFIIFVILQ